MKVLISESIGQAGIDNLRAEGYEVNYAVGISREELLDIISDYDALIIRSTTKVDAELISHAANLKVVGRAGNGVDNIDLAACTRRGIVAVNTPEGNSMAAAELAVAHAYNCFRNFTKAVNAGKNHDFRRGQFVGQELEGKTVGIIGLGRIGAIVARKLQGSGMKVVAYDPYIADERFELLGVTKCPELSGLLSVADLITIHTPKTQETIGIIGAKEIALCKDGVRIVNAARGGLVDEKALYDGLVSGKVAFAGLDVLSPEPNYNMPPEEQDYENPLLTLDNIAITPHLGASTSEASFNVGIEVCKYIGQALRGEIVPAVNMPHGMGADIEEIRPYLHLAESLGAIYYQMSKDPVKSIIVTYSGEIAKEDTGLITLSVIKGFLTPVCDSTVNYVNAEMILEQMNIGITELKSNKIDKYSSKISVKFIADDKNVTISGTAFDKAEVRIIDFMGYKMDFEPTENVIAILNADVPGIIGKMGTLLGDCGINITAMQCSSNKTKGYAESFISVDRVVPRDICEKISQIDGILKASYLHF